MALLIAVVAGAQTGKPASSPQPDMPPPLPEPQPSVAAPSQAPATVTPAAPAAPDAAAATVPLAPGPGIATPPAAASPAAVPQADSLPPPPVGKNEIRLNFQNASLSDVLNYLSEAAGFVIVQNVPVSGTVNVVSKQPVTAEEAVDLLNAVLVDKGYIAIRNGRILKIVSSQNAQKNDLPVEIGSDPERIPRKDGMVTQILPIRYMEAGKLVENLSPLLSANATISANESSNAILLTDTQTNIHRIAEIIHSLDTSISSISSIHVFPLRYADAKDFANILTQLFSPDQGGGRNGQNNQNPAAAFFGRFGGGGGGRGGNGGQPAQPESEARKAASRVIAVADTASNSVVVSAPEEYMPTITDIVSRLDTSTTDITETRIFRLEHADSVELSTILNSLYGDGTTAGGGNKNGNNGQQNNNNRQQPQQNGQPPAGGTSQRALLEARVVAVPDPRTNSIIVNCSRDTMEQIALTIGRLDATDSKKQHVYVHALEHADPDNVATILRGMFGSQTTTSNQPSALNQRTSTGASSAVTGVLNTNSPNTGR